MSVDTDATAETVLVPQSTSSGADRPYHTDTSCRHVTDRMQTWDRDTADEWGLVECRRCRDRRAGGDDDD